MKDGEILGQDELVIGEDKEAIADPEDEETIESLKKDFEKASSDPELPPLELIDPSEDRDAWISRLSLTSRWNLFIKMLMEVEHIWEAHIRGASERDIEEMGSTKVKVLSVMRLSRFSVMLPRFVDYLRSYASLEELIIELEESTQTEEMEGDE